MLLMNSEGAGGGIYGLGSPGLSNSVAVNSVASTFQDSVINPRLAGGPIQQQVSEEWGGTARKPRNPYTGRYDYEVTERKSSGQLTQVPNPSAGVNQNITDSSVVPGQQKDSADWTQGLMPILLIMMLMGPMMTGFAGGTTAGKKKKASEEDEDEEE